jgi:hypothetical protein
LQLCEQRRRLPQIRRVKALGKPAVHRGQHVVGLLALVLGLPQAGQEASASRPRKYGWYSVDPVASSAASPCRMAARPTSLWPCIARAQPCRTVHQANRDSNPCAAARVMAAAACSCTAGASRRH